MQMGQKLKAVIKIHQLKENGNIKRTRDWPSGTKLTKYKDDKKKKSRVFNFHY